MKFSWRVIAAGAMVSVVSADCIHDNLFRCIAGSSSVAIPFCSSYISVPEVTITVTASTLQITSSTSSTTAVASSSALNVRANHVKRASSIQTPACITQASSTYPASRISSACSCMSIPTSTTYTTASASSTSSTSSSSATAPGCTPSSIVMDNNTTYASFYTGANFTEADNNPGNDLSDIFPPESTTFPASENDCQAVQSCADFTFSQPDIYESFALYFLEAENEWSCVAYFDSNTNASYFNVPNNDVEVGYGYTLENIG